MENYTGTFDSQDPGFPYGVRAHLEQTVHEEKQKEKELLRAGQHQFKALWTLAGHALSESTMSAGRLVLPDIVLTIDEAGLIVSSNQAWSTPIGLRPFDKFAFYLQKKTEEDFASENTIQAIFAVVCEDGAKAVWFENFANGSGLKWLRWERSRPIGLAPLSRVEVSASNPPADFNS
ncbi:MAG: hypothetical protein ACJ8FY_17220 [Gemmataceae bacterium]